jgi:hypothetical protein
MSALGMGVSDTKQAGQGIQEIAHVEGTYFFLIRIVTVIIMMRYVDDDLWLLFVHHQQGLSLAADSDLDSILAKSAEGIEAKPVEVAKHSIWRLINTS